MNKTLINFLLMLLLFSGGFFSSMAQSNPYVPNSANYTITGGVLSEQTMRLYFKRSVIIQNLTSLNQLTGEGCFASDANQYSCWLNFIANTRPKFIMGVAVIGACDEWHYMPEDPRSNYQCDYYELAEKTTQEIHNIDDQIICQANIGETVCCALRDDSYRTLIPIDRIDDLFDFSDVGTEISDYFNIYMPAHFTSPFCFESYEMDHAGDKNDDCPYDRKVDLTKPMAMAYVYYQCTKYIDAGYEALAFGQVDNYFAEYDFDPTNPHNPNNFKHINFLFNKVREYARIHGRRNFVLMGGDTRGLYVGDASNKNLVFDYHISKPHIKETRSISKYGTSRAGGILSYGDGLNSSAGFDGDGFDYEATIGKCDDGVTDPGYFGKNPYDEMKGGFNPQFHWYSTVNPFLISLDFNGGVQGFDITAPVETNGCTFPWNWDEATWFSQESWEYRDQFIIYAWHRVRCLNQAGYFVMPGAIPYRAHIGDPEIMYNAYSASCYTDPAHLERWGYGQEETIKNIWKANDFNHGGDPPATVAGQDMRYYNRWANQFNMTDNTTITNMDQIHLGDFDGDGRTDIIMTDNPVSPSWGGIHVFRQQTSGGYNFGTPDLTGGWAGWGEKFYIGDFNGDGKDDFIAVGDINLLGSSVWAGYRLFLSTCTFTTTSFNEVYVAPVTPPTWPSWGEKYYVGDFNGDGNDDFIVMADATLGTSWMGYKVYISSGGLTPTFTEEYSNTFPNSGERLFIGDFNGDGSDDFMTTADKETNVGFLWGGYEVFHSQVTGTTLTGFAQKAVGRWPSWGEDILVGDWNKDGYDDITTVALNKYGINWEGSKTYLSNNAGTHFIYAFDDEDNEAGDILRVSHNKLYNIHTTGSSTPYHILYEYEPLHCSSVITNSAYIARTPGALQSNNTRMDSTSFVARQNNPSTALPNDNTIAYPNPSNDGVFYLQTKYKQNGVIIINDINGKKILEMGAADNGGKINLANYPNGVYILTLKNEFQILNQKIIIQK